MYGTAISADDRLAFQAVHFDAQSGEDMFVIGHLPVADGYTGFVLRVPSKHSSSAVELWVHDDNRGYWQRPIALADGYGDVDWNLREDAWLLDRDADHDLDVIQRRMETEESAVLSDSLQWTFWQESFGQYGWRTNLTDSAARQAFAFPRATNKHSPP